MIKKSFIQYLEEKDNYNFGKEIADTIARNTAMNKDFVFKWVKKYKLDDVNNGNKLMMKYSKSKKWVELMQTIFNDKKPQY